MRLRRNPPRRPRTFPPRTAAAGGTPCAPRRDRRPTEHGSRWDAQWKVGGQPDAASVLTAEVESAAQLLHAVRQTAQAEVPGPRPFGSQSDTVRGDRGDDAPGGAR